MQISNPLPTISSYLQRISAPPSQPRTHRAHGSCPHTDDEPHCHGLSAELSSPWGTESPWESCALLEGSLHPSRTPRERVKSLEEEVSLSEGQLIASPTHCSAHSPQVRWGQRQQGQEGKHREMPQCSCQGRKDRDRQTGTQGFLLTAGRAAKKTQPETP